MDFRPFKQDINELLEEFNVGNFTTLADMKRVWMSRKFSYIYEARPKTNSALFMQTLYSHAISHIISNGALSQRLGGLYCLYCLYETQPYKPCFKIYLSLGELKSLRNLVVDAKENGIGIVPALVKRMIERNMFLFGFVDTADGSMAQRFGEMMKLHDKRIQMICKNLFEDNLIEDYLHMDLGEELDLPALKKMSTEYAKAKELAIKGANDKVDVEDMRHIVKNTTVGDIVERLVVDWNVKKDELYKQTGMSSPRHPPTTDDFDELEELLNE